MRRLAAVVIAFGIALSSAHTAQAHDFWVELEDYWLPVGDASSWARFRVGHAEDEGAWPLLWDRIVSLRAYGAGGISDQQANLQEQTPVWEGGANIRLPHKPGTYVLAMESHHAFSKLPADRFTDYARTEGLSLILADRVARAKEQMDGTEVYSRRAKAIVQVGTAFTNNVTQPIGQSLEIVPERNPYALGSDEPLPVRVFFRGRPLPGAQIDLQTVAPNDKDIATLTTDRDGRAVFTFPRQGILKFNTVWSVPIQNERADYETIFSSLTFGYASKEGARSAR